VTAHFFWREYLAQDATRALAFYKGVLGYDASSADARLCLEYFVLRRDTARAGLFQIPATTSNVRPNWPAVHPRG
jgi:predicted enzyme related to lactoylglutathione lyase